MSPSVLPVPVPSPAVPTPDALWDRYHQQRDPMARRLLLERYVGLVHRAARDLAARVPQVAVDELVSAGAMGLIAALDGFDPARGFAFSTYAMTRIRGAMLDDLRSRAWQPRSVRGRMHRLEAAADQLAAELGRAPRPAEVAARLGVDLPTYWEWRSAGESGATVSLDAPVECGRPDLSLASVLPDPDQEEASAVLEEEERTSALRLALDGLPERERTVLALYYYEELTLRQIAELLEVSESRISQLRSRALRRMRDQLAASTA